MAADGSIAMMVLAMHIRCDRAPDTDVFRSWRNGKNEALGQDEVENFGEADAAFAVQNSAFGIERENLVHRVAQDHTPIAVERRVAVAASSSPRDDIRVGAMQDDLLELALSGWAIEFALLSRIISPTRERCSSSRGEGHHVAAAAREARVNVPAR